MDYYDIIVYGLMDIEGNKLLPESDKTGNIEYKWRLDKKDLSKLDNMVAQMIRRMDEGKRIYGTHEANYIIGVMDDGRLTDCDENMLNKSLNILHHVSTLANAVIIHKKIHNFVNNIFMHVIVQKKNIIVQRPESDIMIMGPYDSGKSSMMGRLVHGQCDNGNGFCRKLILRHVHEKESGNTSSLAYDTIGFKNFNLINYSCGFDFGMENIYKCSDTLVNIIDTPGCMKYIKTNIHAVSSIRPKFIIMCIPLDFTSVNENIYDILNENKEMYIFVLKLCIAFDIVPIFTLTKCDRVLTEMNIDTYKENIGTLFNTWMCEINSKHINFLLHEYIFISSVTNEGYDKLINVLSSHNSGKATPEQNDNILFVINETFVIPEMGCIFHGSLKHGELKVNDIVNVLHHGIIRKMKIKTIQRKTLDVRTLYAGETGSITFFGNDKIIDKTAMIVGDYWKDNIINKCHITSVFTDVENKINVNKKYVMYVANNIVNVELTHVGDNKYELISNMPFFKSDICILRDDNHNYHFIKID